MEEIQSDQKSPELMDAILQSCRVCMATNMNMGLIFDPAHGSIVSERITFCTGIRVKNGDGLPTKICEQCFNNLQVAYNFKNMCILSDGIFTKMAQELHMKREPNDENSADNNNDNFMVDATKQGVKLENNPECNNPSTEVQKKRCRKSSLVHKKKEKDSKKDNENIFTPLKSEGEKLLEPVKTESIGPNGKVKLKRIRRSGLTYKKRNKDGTLKSEVQKNLKCSLVCEPCNLTFGTRREKYHHKKTVHPEIHVCEVCGKSFHLRSSYQSHVLSHRPPTFSCDSCAYRTWNKWDLSKHVLIHTGVKQYQCEYCTASFYVSSNLRSHLRRRHQQGLRPGRFRCELCQREFVEKTQRDRHMDTHRAKVGRFTCGVCDAQYARRCRWRVHMKTQHGIVAPRLRSGRRKTNVVLGEDSAVPLLKVEPVPEELVLVEEVELDD